MLSNKLLLKYARQNRFLIIFTILLGFLSAVFNGIGTALVIPLVLVVLGENQMGLEEGPPLLKNLISVFDFFPENYKLLAMTFIILLAIILKNVTSCYNSIIGDKLSKLIVREMRIQGIEMVLDLDIDFFCKNKIGDINNKLAGEISKTAASLKNLIQLFTISINILTYFFVLISLSWQLTIIGIIGILIIALLNQNFIKRSKYFGKLVAQKNKEYFIQLLEVITGIRLVKTFTNEEEEFEKIKDKIIALEQVSLDAQANSIIIGPLNEISGIIIVLIIIFLGRYYFFDSIQSVSAILLTYLVIFFRLLPFIGRLNQARSQFAKNSVSTQIIAEFFNREDKPFMVKNNGEFTQLKEGINLENVFFKYPKTDKLVLSGINISIPKGSVVALVGSSGSGKSTLADLLARFYDPTEGRITVDGRDLRDLDLKQVRKTMGIVSQDTFLFNNTVAYNIAYGLQNVAQEDIIEAAKRANAYEFIVNLPQGFDTEIGDRGVLLSGGQKQRLAIARALLRNPQILILDEATSALDTVSERLVQEAIDELCQDRTTLVIAHRLSTIQRASKIVVLSQGKVIEQGNHKELLQKNGTYTKLYKMQFAKQSNPTELESINL